MSNAFIDKLSEFAALSKEDVDILVSICRNPQSFPAHHDLVREGDKAGAMFIILEGWACRYKLLPEGTRQITAFLMPGDWCDTHASIPHEMEHAISTLTAAKVAIVARTRLDRVRNAAAHRDKSFLIFPSLGVTYSSLAV
jgi:CRP-like cAMP-binding protein